MNKEIIIDGKKVSHDEPVFIIAEMSANHLQDLHRAKEIIAAAKQAGADAIKLQTYKPDTLTLDCHKDEFLCTPGGPWEGMNLYDLYQKAYTPWEWHKELFDYARDIDITCFSSPFDNTAVDLLEDLGSPAYKIASYEIVDIPLIRRVASTGKPVIISTGVAEKDDIQLALDTCISEGNDNVILLKCVSEYPTPYEEINLRSLPDMESSFSCLTGLSDHSLGDCVAVAATAMGACVVEKHLTLNRADGGPDSSFSMEPDEFKKMVDSVQKTRLSLGDVTYTLTEKQRKSREHARSLYVSKEVKKGELFSEENIKSIRPGYGLHPKYYYDVIGKKSTRDLHPGDALSWEYIEK